MQAALGIYIYIYIYSYQDGVAVFGPEELLDVLPRALELRGVRRRHAPDHPQPPAGASGRLLRARIAIPQATQA